MNHLADSNCPIAQPIIGLIYSTIGEFYIDVFPNHLKFFIDSIRSLNNLYCALCVLLTLMLLFIQGKEKLV